MNTRSYAINPIIAIEKNESLAQGENMNTNKKGTPSPLGASKVASGWNFAVYSKLPVKEIVFASLQNPSAITTLQLDPQKNRTGSIWHIFVPSNDTELLYGFKVEDNLLLDPYAKLIASGNHFGTNAFSEERYKNQPVGVAFSRTPSIGKTMPHLDII